MSCSILFMDAGQRVKTNSWAIVDKGKDTEILYQYLSARNPVPFDIFNQYTDYCEKSGIATADFTPDNIPKIMQMFEKKPGSPFQMHP